ncbi:MAG: M28 family peptidase [Janthinobacterium lividum]
MRISKLPLLALAAAGAFGLTACPSDKPAETTTPPPAAQVKAPAFNADSAYACTARQVAFGPRVPDSKAHIACGNYLVATLKRYGLKVLEQPFEAMTFNGTHIKGRNIIAQFQPQAVRRITLFAHWDTRPFADADKEHKNAPMDGASDGASAVATALEIARTLALQPATATPNVGVDIMLMDAEDWGYETGTQAGITDQIDESNGNSSWCLGSQYWAKHVVPAGYKAEYGILFDMVGAKNGHFTREGVSRQNARAAVDKIWNTAAQIGYSDYFLFTDTDPILDDHVYTNKGGVPTVDIYDHPAFGVDEFFPAYHHTTADNMSIIDRKTMKAVGQTVLQVLYNE